MEGTDGNENHLPEITIAQRWSHNFKFQLKKKKKQLRQRRNNIQEPYSISYQEPTVEAWVISLNNYNNTTNIDYLLQQQVEPKIKIPTCSLTEIQTNKNRQQQQLGRQHQTSSMKYCCCWYSRCSCWRRWWR